MNADRFAEVLDVLLAEVAVRMRRVGGDVARRREDLIREDIAILPETQFVLPPGSVSPPRRAPALPTHRAAFVLPPFPHIALVTALEFSAEQAPEFIPAIWWIACVRTHISPQERADLHALVLIEESHPLAQQWRNQIERDDRFCRKLVWVVPTSADALRASAAGFLDRSFLAQPWADDSHAAARGLDPLSDLAESVARGVDFPEQTVRRWLGLLARANGIGRDLAEEMVRIAEEPDGN